MVFSLILCLIKQPVHLDFIVAAANLKAEIYGIAHCRDRERIAQIVSGFVVPDFQPKSGVRIEVNEAEAQSSRNNGSCGIAHVLFV